MARRASLEPRKTRKRQLPFVVNLPPLLSSTGKRERRYFDTQAAAKALCKQQKIRLVTYRLQAKQKLGWEGFLFTS
jgi:hypothetical protein